MAEHLENNCPWQPSDYQIFCYPPPSGDMTSFIGPYYEERPVNDNLLIIQEIDGESTCPSTGNTTQGTSTPTSSKSSEDRRGRTGKKSRGGNSTARLPLHPNPVIERKRAIERVKNSGYQLTSRTIKEAEHKSALAQIALVWQFFRNFQSIEKARNIRSVTNCQELIEAERRNEEEMKWREKERQLEEFDHIQVRGLVTELELMMQIEAEKLKLETKEIRRQAEDRTKQQMREKGLE